MRRHERRHYQRIRPDRPIPAVFGGRAAFIRDISLNGAGIVHREALDPAEREPMLEFDWDGQHLRFRCDVVRMETHRLEAPQRKEISYHSGVEWLEAAASSQEILREIVERHVERALDEQRANALGIPAAAPRSYQSATRRRGYLRCRFRQGTWQREPTSDPSQPLDGFTISAEERAEQVEMLCETYELADREGRDMIRAMAEISVSTAEGVPTRRYDP